MKNLTLVFGLIGWTLAPDLASSTTYSSAAVRSFTQEFSCVDEASSDAFGSYTTCSDQLDSPPGPFTYSVSGSASARGVVGDLGITVSYTSENSRLGGQGANAYAHFLDTIWVIDGNLFLDLYSDVEEVNLIIPVYLDGSTSIVNTPNSSGGANVSFGFGTTASDQEIIYSRNLSFSGESITDELIGNLGTTTVSKTLLRRDQSPETISEGTSIFSSLTGNAVCGVFKYGETCGATSSFFNSAKFGPAQLVDQDGNQISDLSIVSASGFDYRVGFQGSDTGTGNGGDDLTSVPLPAGMPLLLLGLGTLGLIRYRQSIKQRSPRLKPSIAFNLRKGIACCP